MGKALSGEHSGTWTGLVFFKEPVLLLIDAWSSVCLNICLSQTNIQTVDIIPM